MDNYIYGRECGENEKVVQLAKYEALEEENKRLNGELADNANNANNVDNKKKFSIEEIKDYLEGQLFLHDHIENRRLEGTIREIDDYEDGIEAVMLRRHIVSDMTNKGDNTDA